MSDDKKTARKEQENRSGNPNPKPGPGRPKGVPNKVSGLAKENIAKVFEELGGIDKMVLWAADNSTEFYKLYARLIPVEVSGEGGGDIKITINRVVHSAGNSG